MADEITTKKVENLSENTEPADTDVYLFGASGTNVIKKIKWSNILSKLKSILFANNLTTTQDGYGLDARQGKALKDEIDKINTNKIDVDYFTVLTTGGKINTTNGGGNTVLDVKKEGYKALGVVSFSISSSYYAPSGLDFNLDAETVNFTMRRVDGSTSSESINVYVKVLYVKVDTEN